MDHELLTLRALLTRVTGDGMPFTRIRAILSALDGEATGISELMKHPDPMKSSVAIDLLLNQEKARLRDLIAKSRSEAAALISSFRTSEEAARRTKANLKPDAYASELRSALRQLDTESRNGFMAVALKAGDASVVAAVTSAPAILSGLTAQQAEQYRESFLDTVSGPSSAGICDELQNVCDVALRTADGLAQPVGFVSGPPSIEAQKAVALAARAA